ncbi:serine/threonine protein kinase [bacterium]|nr:serine/threonine protein kinase [bacterium]
MLSAVDIISGKIILQLALATADEVRAFLRVTDRDRGTRDLVNHLAAAGRLDAKSVELIRHRAALYEHVRGEAAYVRALERQTQVPKTTVAQMIAGLERSAFRVRLGSVLVKQGTLTTEQDSALAALQRTATQKDDARVIERYRQEDFAGIERPLIPGSRLDPLDFKISTLFRGKETRALVDQAEVAALRAAAARASEPRPAAPPPAPVPPLPPPPRSPSAPAGKKPFVGGIDAVRALKRIGAYSIVEVLGAGGMGCVFLGQQDGRCEFAAIKVMLDQAASPVEKGRFKREIRVTQGISHKNVIGVIDSGETEDGLTYLVVPALAGKELRALLDTSPAKILEPAVAVRILEQVLEGLQAVHDAGIVHRDMKPENVFVLAGGKHEVKIMDFGLAKRGSQDEDEVDDAVFRTTPGEDIVGSPAYIAPESITQDEVDGRTDIYSVGVMFFEMLTGKRPIESETAQGYMTQHLICPPPTLAEASPDRKWPQELEKLVERMLAKTRDERPASCRAIQDELRSGLRDRIARGEDSKPLAETVDVEPPAQKDEKPWGVRGLLGRLFAAKSP